MIAAMLGTLQVLVEQAAEGRASIDRRWRNQNESRALTADEAVAHHGCNMQTS